RDPALSARAATAPDHTAVELPYAGGQLAMLLVVPAEGVPLDQVLDGLGEGGLGAVAAGLAPATVDLTMPTWGAGRALDLAPGAGSPASPPTSRSRRRCTAPTSPSTRRAPRRPPPPPWAWT